MWYYHAVMGPNNVNVFIKIRKALHEGGLGLLWSRVVTKIRFLFKSRPTVIPDQLYHSLPKGVPSVRWSVRPIRKPTPDDVRLVDRIVRAYTRAIADEPVQAGSHAEDIWDVIKKNRHDDFNEVFASGDSRKVAEYLCNMHNRGITHGISDFNTRILKRIGKKRTTELMVLVRDHVVALAESVSALLCGQENIYKDPILVIQDIEKRIGIDITPPDIDGGLVKAKLGEAHFSLRDIWGIYVAWRIVQIVGPKARVCEIGAGLGKATLYASRLGIKDYSIFDLPQINAVQAWYLMKSLPEASFALYGESVPEGDVIKILPYWEFPEGKYDLVLNVDSFPEIAREIVDDYLRKIKTCSTYFLSINHETERSYGYIHGPAKGQHLAMPRVIESAGGFRQIYRFPFWVRKNYIEELYKVGSGS